MPMSDTTHSSPISLCIPLADIPQEGRTLIVSETTLWEEGIREFSMACTLESPLTAKVSLTQLPSGILVRGTLQGKVLLPCTRCAEETTVCLDDSFETFETLPNEDGSDTAMGEDESDESISEVFSEEEGESRIIEKDGDIALDLRALLWEEFLLALPLSPLCQEGCKGLCPHCGHNLNQGPCGCKKEEGDPRLALFRSMKIADKQN